MTAAQEVVRSAPDGYTLGLVVSTHASLAAINKKMPYDTERDFAPVIFVGSIPLVLLVSQKSSFKTLPELLAAAKAKPGSLNYAFPGVGLSHHFAGELLKQRANVDIQAVSYRGTAPALNDVIGGAVEMTFGTLPAVMGAIGGGIVRPLAITAPKTGRKPAGRSDGGRARFPGFRRQRMVRHRGSGQHAKRRHLPPERRNKCGLARSRAPALAEAEQCHSGHNHAGRIPQSCLGRNQEALVRSPRKPASAWTRRNIGRARSRKATNRRTRWRCIARRSSSILMSTRSNALSISDMTSFTQIRAGSWIWSV